MPQERRAPQQKSRPRIGLLALTPIPDDPRVRRQGDAFVNAGWQVQGFGLSGGVSAPTNWPICAVAAPSGLPQGGGISRARHLVHALTRRVGVHLGLVPTEFHSAAYRHSLEALYRRASRARADLWLSNDWTTLPLAVRLAREQGALYGYDTHELSTEEYQQNLSWRILKRPLIRAIESSGIGGAAVVSCVSDGIAARLAEIYRLAEPPLVIRNVPSYQEARFRRCGDVVRVLYHGVVAPGRGLEACVQAVAAWRQNFELTIRGPAEAGYLSSLQGLAARAGVAGRVHFVPPVPTTELVLEAMEFDVGLFALPGHSQHNRYALPNKIFEYAMAGLALCVSDLPDMASLVRRHDLGVLIEAPEPAAIATAINGLDHRAIDRYKRHALAAAKELCWERESQELVRSYANALARNETF
jgi:glycosyltransferase involved in cell wall biosynthesis